MNEDQTISVEQREGIGVCRAEVYEDAVCGAVRHSRVRAIRVVAYYPASPLLVAHVLQLIRPNRFMLKRISLARQQGSQHAQQKCKEKLQGRGSSSKAVVMGLLERHGEVRMGHFDTRNPGVDEYIFYAHRAKRAEGPTAGCESSEPLQDYWRTHVLEGLEA